MTPYIIAFAAVFSLAAYGLHRRTVWAWWAGWVVFFLAAGIYGTYTYSALYYAETLAATLAAAAYIGGGAVLWVPAAVWWCSRRSYFGRRPVDLASTRTNKNSLNTSIHKKAMDIELPPVIASFFHATNTREFADFLSLFTADAHVNDEANDYYGAEIAAWIDRATADTKPTADVTDITRDGEQLVVTAQLSGNFPGSPIQLRYYFTLKDAKIATLLIKA